MIQRLIRDGRDATVIGLEDDRGLVRIAAGQIAVEAVVRRIQFAVFEPLVERRVPVVENLRERTALAQMLARKTCPESFVILRGLGHERAVSVHAFNCAAACCRNVLGRDERGRFDGRHGLLALIMDLEIGEPTEGHRLGKGFDKGLLMAR